MPNQVHEVFPYICVKDASIASQFYQQAFEAKEILKLKEPDGRVGHLELQLGRTTLLISEEFPDMDVLAPNQEQASRSFCIHLHVDSCDDLVKKAEELGATVLMKPADQFYGERSARIRDPFGHIWLIGHSIEEVSSEEMQTRYTKLFEQ